VQYVCGNNYYWDAIWVWNSSFLKWVNLRAIFTWKPGLILEMGLLGFDVCLESFMHEGV
jgi:hypothetical protein